MIVTIKVVNNGMLSCADIGEFAGSISILPINKLLLFKPKNVGKYNKIKYKPQIHPQLFTGYHPWAYGGLLLTWWRGWRWQCSEVLMTSSCGRSWPGSASRPILRSSSGTDNTWSSSDPSPGLQNDKPAFNISRRSPFIGATSTQSVTTLCNGGTSPVRMKDNDY